MDKKANILKTITDAYLSSKDFNGTPVLVFIEGYGFKEAELQEILISLIQEKKISLNFGDVHPNPHIKAFWEEPEEKQIEKLRVSDLKHTCAYPARAHLEKVIDTSKYQDRPFTLRLALGEPQLSFLSFDLSVLETYRNDPRYCYDVDDISGRLSYHDSAGLSPSDQVFLQTFGFSYDSELNRAVAVFLCYLSNLTPEHQQVWNAKIISGDYTLHPDYYKASILGRFPDGVSIFDAFVEELHQINEMCTLMGRPPFFRKDLREERKPREFCFLVRPTSKEFYDFVHTLNKAISDNINKEFFQDDLPLEYDEVRGDGKVVVHQKGTIQLLDEWLEQEFKPADRETIKEMINAFKEIRKLRQPPAHKIIDNAFDQEFFKKQRELGIIKI